MTITRRQVIKSGASWAAASVVGATVLTQPREAQAFGVGAIIAVGSLVVALGRVTLALGLQGPELVEARRQRRAERRWWRLKRTETRAERREMRLARRGRGPGSEGLDITASHDRNLASVVHPYNAGRVDDVATALAVAGVWTASRGAVLLRPSANGRYEDQRGNEWYRKVETRSQDDSVFKEAEDFVAALDIDLAGELEDTPLMSPHEIRSGIRSIDRIVSFRRAHA